MRAARFPASLHALPAAALLLAAAVLCRHAAAAVAPAVPDRLGVAAWTFRDVTFLEAFEKTAGLGLTRIEAFESQKLAPDDPATVGGDLSAGQLARIKAALAKHGLARGEYAIALALHNHPDEASEYRDPKHLAGVLASRGPRIGACCDIGHWQRRGLDTVAGLKLLDDIAMHYDFIRRAGVTPGTYLPTARAVVGGGYSAVIESNWVGPDGGRLLVDERVRMLQDLWPPQSKDQSST